MTHDHTHSEEELQTLNIHAQMIAEQLEKVDASVMELEYIKNGLSELNGTEKGKEILAPVSNGIFFRTTLQSSDTLLVNVGHDVVVEKSVSDTKLLLDARIREMGQVREQLLAEMQKIEAQLIHIGEH